MTTVTDADREAAAAIAVLPEMRDLILAGRADHHAEAFARHREAAEARARFEGMEIMREAAKAAVHHSLYAVGRIEALDPAAILEAHTRAKEQGE